MKKIYGIHTVTALLKTKPQFIKKIYLQGSHENQRLLTIRSLSQLAHIALTILTRSHLDLLLPKGAHHQGVVAEVHSLPSYSEIDLEKLLTIDNVLLLILDGVQDPHNLGACLRSANAFGVHAVIAPKNRAVGLTEAARKVACGAAEITPFITVTNISRVLKQFKKQGIWLVGTESGADTPINQVDLKGPVGLVMGSEQLGLRRLTKEHCDYLACIPMQGILNSFNVSVATGICLYEINQQRIK